MPIINDKEQKPLYLYIWVSFLLVSIPDVVVLAWGESVINTVKFGEK